MKKFKEILPGLLLCIVIAYVAKFLGSFVPSIGGASLAIFIGIIVGNTFGNRKIFNDGARFSEGALLSYSIVLLGGTLSFKTLLDLGFGGLGFIVLQMVVTIIGAIYIGKKLGFSENFQYLMASGNAVCGSSAIAATAPVIGASSREKSITITIVNVTGTVLLFVMPFLGYVLYDLEELQTSALIGGTLQSVGQVVASGLLVDENVKELAMLFKIVRVIFLVFVVYYFSRMNSKKTPIHEEKAKIAVPWYIYGFFILCILKTLGILNDQVSEGFKWVSHQFEIIALAGIGMRVKIEDLIEQGPKASFYALGVAGVQIIAAIVFIRLLL